MTEPRATLDPETTARLADFARACKAAARAVSLYPAAHPAIGATLGRLNELTAVMTASGPFTVQVRPQTLVVRDLAPARVDSAIVELADMLRRHLIGALTLNAGIDTSSWRTLFLLLARTPEDVRADGGISHLWATAGGPSVEIEEIDYAEVLREKQGDAATIERVIAAAMAGPQLELDDSAMRTLLEIVGDPLRLTELMKQLDAATADAGVGARTAAFLSLLKGLTEYVGRTNPAQLDQVFRQVGHAAGTMSAEAMLELLARRTKPEAVVGSVNVVNAVVHRMADSSVAQFVSNSVITERGATERLAHAFQTLAPERDRQRHLLALAQEDVAASELGREDMFAELWQRVETMLTSYSDASFVSDDYARELTSARTRATDVEATNDDPPERMAAWLATVSDTALRALDLHLLVDLLTIEPDPSRWRDVAETVVTHADDLVRVGYFDQAWLLADSVAIEGQKEKGREAAARAALERFGRGAMMKHVAKHLRGADEEGYERFKHLCHGIGPAVIPPLAEVLSNEQDARSRRRLRDILVGFGAAGRESVQRLMNAPNWEVRRTAAYLLREFGGSEGLRELQPLLTDTEPLVQREAIQALVLSGSEAAAQILLQALKATTGRPRQTLISELSSMRDERAAPLFCHIVRHVDRRAFPVIYLAAIDALGSFGGPDAVGALKDALQHGDWLAPLRTRRTRAAAARALRRIGDTAAIDVLREASTRGSRGARSAARAELGQL
jgi:HEAT repeat protein